MFSGREDRNAEELLVWEERNDRWNERGLFCGGLICRLRWFRGFCVQILPESDSSEVGVSMMTFITNILGAVLIG